MVEKTFYDKVMGWLWCLGNKKKSAEHRYESELELFWYVITGIDGKRTPPRNDYFLLGGEVKLTNEHLCWLFDKSIQDFGKIMHDKVMIMARWLNHKLQSDELAFDKLKREFELGELKCGTAKQITTA